MEEGYYTERFCDELEFFKDYFCDAFASQDDVSMDQLKSYCTFLFEAGLDWDTTEIEAAFGRHIFRLIANYLESCDE